MKIQLVLLLEDNLDSLIDHGLPTGIQLQPGKEVFKSSMSLCRFEFAFNI
jgi:hypothetical protein